MYEICPRWISIVCIERKYRGKKEKIEIKIQQHGQNHSGFFSLTAHNLLWHYRSRFIELYTGEKNQRSSFFIFKQSENFCFSEAIRKENVFSVFGKMKFDTELVYFSQTLITNRMSTHSMY